MKTNKIVLACVIALASLSASTAALAQHHRGRVSVGIGFGFGFGYPYYGYGPYYPYYHPYYYPPYYPAPVVVQQQTPVYVESQPQAQAQQPGGYWYYCNDSRAYYPYVKDCASGWQRVAPQPQN